MEHLTSSHPTYDVAVLGAGPAGTCATLRLLQLGYTVALIEQHPFPRPQIGEALSPGIFNLFEYLQAPELLNHESYLRNLPANVLWESQNPRRLTTRERGPSLIVDRSQLDHDLLKLCQQRGATLLQPARFQGYKTTSNHQTLLLKTDQVTQTLNASYIMDARGRLGAEPTQRIPVGPPSIAIWTHHPASRAPSETCIEAIPQGWVWGSPLPNRTYRTLLFIEPDNLRNSTRAIRWKELLEKSAQFHFATKGIDVSRFQTCPVQPYRHANPWTGNYLKLGESAFTLDPLSSTGVEKAMRFSLQSVIAFHTLRKKGMEELARAFYVEKLQTSMDTHAQWTQTFYTQAWPDNTHSFWSKRRHPIQSTQSTQIPSKQNPAPTLPSLSVTETLHRHGPHPITLSPHLTYTQRICVIADTLEQREAIQHPNLKEPIVFLEGHEIPPLLKALPTNTTLNQLLTHWTHHLPPSQTTRLATALIALKILIPPS